MSNKLKALVFLPKNAKLNFDNKPSTPPAVKYENRKSASEITDSKILKYIKKYK